MRTFSIVHHGFRCIWLGDNCGSAIIMLKKILMVSIRPATLLFTSMFTAFQDILCSSSIIIPISDGISSIISSRSSSPSWTPEIADRRTHPETISQTFGDEATSEGQMVKAMVLPSTIMFHGR
jgi:hypothetical protein